MFVFSWNKTVRCILNVVDLNRTVCKVGLNDRDNAIVRRIQTIRYYSISPARRDRFAYELMNVSSFLFV